MAEIVHITFEKLTGLKGEIEGYFTVTGEIDLRLPIIYVGVCKGAFVFSNNNKKVYLHVPRWENIKRIKNYREHFQYGVNFLIKEWSYGGGVRINSQSPN